ncbi:MAG: hypothetical protein ACXWKW_02035 [Asticcacaulis sp.]
MEAPQVKPLTLASSIFRIAALSVAALLWACQPKPAPPADPEAADAAALEAKGFAHTPQIDAITANGAGFVQISGQGVPGSRVRFTFTDPLRNSTQGIGVTADGAGHFSAEVPITPSGGVYDVAMDDNGRLMPAEGRLYVPSGNPAKAVLMRSGSPSLPLFDGGGALAVMDYDGSGAFALSGHVRPAATVDVALDGQVLAHARADAKGLYSLMIHISKLPPDEVLNIAVTSAGVSAKAGATLPDPAGTGDRVSAAGEGWRVEWNLPGGGRQATFVF